MNWQPLTIALVPTAIAWSITVWQVRTQRVRQIEDVYVARYWSLLDKFSAATLRGLDGHMLEPQEELAIRLYFRLSEDEADLRSQGWVSDDTWRDWSGAISSQMHRQPFARLWVQTLEDAEDGRDYEFKHLRRLLHDRAYDPPPSGILRGWLRRAPWRRSTGS
ncbi:hypothetical protein [Streptomyces sp. NPDC048357]|uniref:hypothetical protein n=1 Tax=Streptomyces sp. NPDC048357 TaxID=3154719 RepID=UPI003440F8FD